MANYLPIWRDQSICMAIARAPIRGCNGAKAYFGLIPITAPVKRATNDPGELNSTAISHPRCTIQTRAPRFPQSLRGERTPECIRRQSYPRAELEKRKEPPTRRRRLGVSFPAGR